MISTERSALPVRKSLRLPGYDYRSNGAYFVMICTHERRLLFQQERYRRVAESCWEAIPDHFPHATLDGFVVMPNHVHGILFLSGDDAPPVGAQHAAPGVPPVEAHHAPSVGAQHAAPERPRSTHSHRTEPGSLGAIVRSYKAAATREIHRMPGSQQAPVWQRNYYEHAIRNKAALNRIRQYIIDNPARWVYDRDNPSGVDDSDETAFWREFS